MEAGGLRCDTPPVARIGLLGLRDLDPSTWTQGELIRTRETVFEILHQVPAPRDLDAIILIVSAASGPMPATVLEIERTRILSTPIAAVVVVETGVVDDDELVQLVEIELRLLLEELGHESASVPFLRFPRATPQPSDEDWPRLAEAIRQSRIFPLPHDPRYWQFLVDAVGGEEEANALRERGYRSRTLGWGEFDRELSWVAAEACQVWDRGVAANWFVASSSYLDGARPVDVFVMRGPDDVVAALSQIASGSFA